MFGLANEIYWRLTDSVTIQDDVNYLNKVNNHHLIIYINNRSSIKYVVKYKPASSLELHWIRRGKLIKNTKATILKALCKRHFHSTNFFDFCHIHSTGIQVIIFFTWPVLCRQFSGWHINIPIDIRIKKTRRNIVYNRAFSLWTLHFWIKYFNSKFTGTVLWRL